MNTLNTRTLDVAVFNDESSTILTPSSSTITIANIGTLIGTSANPRKTTTIIPPATTSITGNNNIINNIGRDQYNYTFTFAQSQTASLSSSTRSRIAPSLSFNDAPLDLLSVHFTGRQEELTQVISSLEVVRGNVPSRCALYGDHGVGKSQLTLVLAEKSFSQGHYSCIFWISSTTIEKLHQGFSKLLHLVGHADYSSPSESVRLTAARRWLEDFSHGRWLLVLDNVAWETVNFLREHLPRKNSNGNILFTTRTDSVANELAHASGQQHDIVELRIPHVEDATRLLLGHFKNGDLDADESKVREIVKCVGCLPLAIAQIAAYMKQTGSTLDTLLTMYKSNHKIDMLKWENKLLNYEEKSVAATFTCQLEALQQESPDASNLLKILAFLDPESIPVNMLITGASALHEGKGKGQADEAEITQVISSEMSSLLALIHSPTGLPNAVAELKNRSLINQQRTGQSFFLRMHDLIQLIVLDHMKKTDAEWFEYAVELACSAFDQVQHPDWPECWPQCETLIPHIQALTMRRDLKISTKTKMSLLHANYWNAIYLHSRGRYMEAEVLCQQVLSSRRKLHGAEHLDTLSVMHYLAIIYTSQGRYSEAEALFKQVLINEEKQLGPEHVYTLTTMHDLAFVYEFQGRYSEAETFFIQVLTNEEKQLGPEHGYTLTTMQNLARIYKSQGRYSEAETLFKKVCMHREKQFGAEHVYTLTTMHNLARVYECQGRYNGAETLFKQILASREKQLGLEHVDTISTIHDLARVYESQGRYSEAEALFKLVLSNDKKQLGPEHASTISTLHYLARVYRCQGRYSEAEMLFKQVLLNDEKQLGPEHVSSISTLHNLARVYRCQGRYSEAETLFKQVLSYEEKQLGPKHIYTLATRHDLARVYESQCRYCEAETLFKQVLSDYAEQLGSEHVSFLSTSHYLARVYRCQGRYSEAGILFQQVLTNREKQLGSEHVSTLSTLHELARVYESQDRHSEAETLFQQVLTNREKQLGPEHVSTLSTLHELARVYKSQRRYAEAEELVAKVLASREVSLGFAHPDTQETRDMLANLRTTQGSPKMLK